MIPQPFIQEAHLESTVYVPRSEAKDQQLRLFHRLERDEKQEDGSEQARIVRGRRHVDWRQIVLDLKGTDWVADYERKTRRSWKDLVIDLMGEEYAEEQLRQTEPNEDRLEIKHL